MKMNTNPADYNVYFDETLNAVVMNWSGYFTSNQFREGTELMLNTMIQNKCNRVLAGVSELVLIGSEDQEWLIRSFIPRATKFGFQSIAIVKPRSYFGKVAIESVTENVNNEQFAVSLFDSTEDAVGWLKALTTRN